MAQLAAVPGARGAQGLAGRAAPGPRVGLLLGVHAHRDRGPVGPAAGDCQGAHEVGAEEDPGLLRRQGDGGAGMSGGDAGRDRFEDLAAAYALGALGDEERRGFEAYLAEHPQLQAEVEELGEAARLLALAPKEYKPPPDLRRNLLERVGGEAGTAFADHRQRSRLGALIGPAGLGMAAA